MSFLTRFTIFILISIGLVGLWGTLRKEQIGRFDPLIEEASRKYGVDPALIRAVIWRESNFDPDAAGLARERGLMQVTPAAGKDWAQAEGIDTYRPTDLFDPRTNIEAGSWYLARGLRRWAGADRPEVFALAEYNAGPTHARRWAEGLPEKRGDAFLSRMDYPQTRDYIDKVTARYRHYLDRPDPNMFEVVWDQMNGYWLRWVAMREARRRQQ